LRREKRFNNLNKKPIGTIFAKLKTVAKIHNSNCSSYALFIKKIKKTKGYFEKAIHSKVKRVVLVIV